MKILLVDDDPVSRLLLLPLLDKWGYEVEVARDGTSAWAALQAPEAPRLVLMDWMMPGLSGVEVCRKLRARVGEPYTYVILLTVRHDQQDVLEGLESGADDYLAKPCNAPALRARIRIGGRILQMQADLIQARELVKFKSTHDLLTGTWSRGAAIDMLERELSRANREGRPLGLILVDLDRFRSINDSLGQLAGDEVLREAALSILSSIRIYDVAGRSGGEEFLILLPGCDASAVRNKAERIRKIVAALPLKTNPGGVSLTASLGAFSAMPDEFHTSQSVLRSLNIALCRAKELGRNRVEMFNDETVDEAPLPGGNTLSRRSPA
ncbi:MAG TPA: diguanylate cyclase [Candidatus Acidoferrales bacterium]|nr:diguanylate cyclase [Candidatus Acidoferrales bacterium]